MRDVPVRWFGAVAIAASAICGCPEERGAEQPGASVNETRRSRTEPAPEKAGPEELEPEALSPEEAARAALEAACFDGSQDACDQLGH